MALRFATIVRLGCALALLLGGLGLVPPRPAAAATPGAMYSWGGDSSGALCLGSLTTRQLTAQPAIGAATSGVIAVAVGGYYSLFLKADGTIHACGQNSTYGTLGIGVTDSSPHPTPQQVVGVSGATAIAAGVDHSLAVAGGNVYAWGRNGYGELGQGSSDGNDHPTPLLVPGLGDVKAVAAGYETSLAIKNDGTLWTWGLNNAGQLGLGSAGGTHTSPAQVFLSPGVPLLAQSAAGGEQQTAVVATDGKVYYFGINGQGQSGNGTVDSSNHPTPTQIAILGADNVAVASGYRHLLVLKADGTVWAWGQNDFGQVGRGAPSGVEATPAAVAGIAGAVAIGAGGSHSLAILGDGSMRGWGANGAGQLGNNSQSFSGTPVTVSAPIGAVALATGPYAQHSLAVRVAPPATTIVSVSPLALQFPNQPLHVASASKTVRLSNSGQQPLVVGNVALAGANPGDFAQTNDCGAAVPPTGTCTITVTFTPAAVGNRAATLRITDNAATSPQEVGLSGNGLDVPPPYNLIVSAAGAGGGAVAVGATGIAQPTPNHYQIPQNNVATLSAQPGGGSYFIGWKLDGIFVGWANPVTLTMNTDHTMEATFAPLPTFGDVPGGQDYTDAVLQLAARDIIRGCDQAATPRLYCPDERTLRAQMAALIARAMGWDAEDHATPFPDQGIVDNDLWRNVGTVAFYNVARGYQDGTYDPTGDVLAAQTISFITRAMITKAYWNLQPADSGYPNVPPESGHRADIATFVHYAGALPENANTAGDFAGWDRPSTRAWFARALWQALNSYFGVDQPGSGGYVP